MRKICTLILTSLIVLTAIGLTACGGSQFKVAWPNAELLGSDKTITADYTGTPDDLEYICRVTVKDGKITMMMIDDEQTDSLIAMLTDSSILP